jgi:acetyl esterase/lipase
MPDYAITQRRLLASLLLVGPGLLVSGYVVVRRACMSVLYHPVSFPDSQVLRDVPYRKGSMDRKHRLNLFLPKGTDWPILIFVHGGGLDSGDKGLRVCGSDIYGNIGRFYASRGIGVAIINYRLQPGVNWPAQAEDVAHAIAWIYRNVENHGGNPGHLFLGGHSAGAHLAARVALDSRALTPLGLSPAVLSGVILVSGAGFDLSDKRTYELGHSLRDYEARFRCGDPTSTWLTDASPITCVKPGAPPFLLLYAEGDSQSLQRQSELLHEALQRNQVSSRLVVVPREDHSRIVLTLSRPDKISAPTILGFIADAANSRPHPHGEIAPAAMAVLAAQSPA